MQIAVFPDKLSLAEAAANDAANAICKAVEHDSLARIVAATGASQFEFLEHLTKIPGIDWPHRDVSSR
jgi:glucosamine-6-phosphate deaminase